jgi:hypothetical protein
VKLSLTAKLLFGTGLVLVLVFFAALVDLGFNAGKVLRGVDVDGFDIGGMTFEEAEAALDERGTEMQVTPMIFTTEGFACTFSPGRIGWGPQPRDTALAGMAIGRDGSIVSDAKDRLRSWFGGGTSIDWAGKPDSAQMGRELARCQKNAEGLGLTIDLPKLRFLIKKTIVTWPRNPTGIGIPLESS